MVIVIYRKFYTGHDSRLSSFLPFPSNDSISFYEATLSTYYDDYRTSSLRLLSFSPAFPHISLSLPMGHRLLLLSQVGTSRDRSGLASFSRSDVPDSDSRELVSIFPGFLC